MYIVLVFRSESAYERLQALYPRYGLSPVSIENPFVLAQLHAGEKTYGANSHMCHCQTGLGSLCRLDTRARTSAEDLREETKRKKEGWSESRLARWRGERETTSRRKWEAWQTKYEPDAQNWLEFLTAAGANAPGILLHWYGASVETESFGTLTRISLPRATLRLSELMNLKEDIVYEFA